jgi:hypothetical protein
MSKLSRKTLIEDGFSLFAKNGNFLGKRWIMNSPHVFFYNHRKFFKQEEEEFKFRFISQRKQLSQVNITEKYII